MEKGTGVGAEVFVGARVPEPLKDRYSRLAELGGDSLSEVIRKLLATWAEAQGEDGVKVENVKSLAALQRERDKRERVIAIEELINTAVTEADLYCWPAGRLYYLSQEEKGLLKVHDKIIFTDENGNFYDGELYLWNPDGTYNPTRQVGGGAAKYKHTLLPAMLSENWHPSEITPVLARRVLWIAGQLPELVERHCPVLVLECKEVLKKYEAMVSEERGRFLSTINAQQ